MTLGYRECPAVMPHHVMSGYRECPVVMSDNVWLS